MLLSCQTLWSMEEHTRSSKMLFLAWAKLDKEVDSKLTILKYVFLEKDKINRDQQNIQVNGKIFQ